MKPFLEQIPAQFMNDHVMRSFFEQHIEYTVNAVNALTEAEITIGQMSQTIDFLIKSGNSQIAGFTDNLIEDFEIVYSALTANYYFTSFDGSVAYQISLPQNPASNFIIKVQPFGSNLVILTVDGDSKTIEGEGLQTLISGLISTVSFDAELNEYKIN